MIGTKKQILLKIATIYKWPAFDLDTYSTPKIQTEAILIILEKSETPQKWSQTKKKSPM